MVHNIKNIVLKTIIWDTTADYYKFIFLNGTYKVEKLTDLNILVDNYNYNKYSHLLDNLIKFYPILPFYTCDEFYMTKSYEIIGVKYNNIIK